MIGPNSLPIKNFCAQECLLLSLDELLPTAEEYGEHHVAIAGLVMGMLVIAISLVLFL